MMYINLALPLVVQLYSLCTSVSGVLKQTVDRYAQGGSHVLL